MLALFKELYIYIYNNFKKIKLESNKYCQIKVNSSCSALVLVFAAATVLPMRNSA